MVSSGSEPKGKLELLEGGLSLLLLHSNSLEAHVQLVGSRKDSDQRNMIFPSSCPTNQPSLPAPGSLSSWVVGKTPGAESKSPGPGVKSQQDRNTGPQRATFLPQPQFPL